MIENLLYLDNWKNKKYIIWTVAIPLAQFGYFVPYCHLVSSFFTLHSSINDILSQPQFAKDVPLDMDEKLNGEKAANLIMCLGICFL